MIAVFVTLRCYGKKSKRWRKAAKRHIDHHMDIYEKSVRTNKKRKNNDEKGAEGVSEEKDRIDEGKVKKQLDVLHSDGEHHVHVEEKQEYEMKEDSDDQEYKEEDENEEEQGYDENRSDEGTEHSEQKFVDTGGASDEEELLDDEGHSDVEELVDDEGPADAEKLSSKIEHEEEKVVQQQGIEFDEKVRTVAETDPAKLKTLTHEDIAKAAHSQEMRRRAQSAQKRMSFALPNMGNTKKKPVTPKKFDVV